MNREGLGSAKPRAAAGLWDVVKSRRAHRLLVRAVGVAIALSGGISVAQQPDVNARNRSHLQQQCALAFIRSRDSVYHLQHDDWKPFSSTASVDSFMRDVEESWVKSAHTTDADLIRFDSYVYGLVERSKTGGAWSEEYVWKKYMVPAFLADYASCTLHPSSRKAAFLWPGNAGNVFGYARWFDLPANAWSAFKSAYEGMDSVLDEYVSFGRDLDSSDIKSLKATRSSVSAFKTLYPVLDAIYGGRLDEASSLLSAGYAPQRGSVRFLARPLGMLVRLYANSGMVERGFALLDTAAHATAASDIPNDSLKVWYGSLNPQEGGARFASAVRMRKTVVMVPSGRRARLIGRYKDLTGDSLVDLSSLGGRTVLLDFWATWCHPCEEEIPALREFYRKYLHRTDFMFLSVSSDAVEGGASVDVVRDFARKNGIDYAVLYDTKDSSLTRLFGVSGWPTKCLISPRGEILQRPGSSTVIDIPSVGDYLDSDGRDR